MEVTLPFLITKPRNVSKAHLFPQTGVMTGWWVLFGYMPHCPFLTEDGRFTVLAVSEINNWDSSALFASEVQHKTCPAFLVPFS